MRTLLLSLLFFLPTAVFAAEVRVVSREAAVGVGDTSRAEVVLSSKDDPINALEGSILFSQNLELVRIESGSSPVLFWAEPPRAEEGKVSFSGIIPGGYKEESSIVVSLVLKAVAPSAARVEPSGMRAFRHDGEGTIAPMSLSPLVLEVGAEPRGVSADIRDTEAPDPFEVEVVRDPTVYGGAWVLVFATQDKGSGIARYEVCEKDACTQAASPHLLRDQSRSAKVVVKAVDNAGNERVAEVAREAGPSWLILIFMAALIAVGVMIRKLAVVWRF